MRVNNLAPYTPLIWHSFISHEYPAMFIRRDAARRRSVVRIPGLAEGDDKGEFEVTDHYLSRRFSRVSAPL